LCVLEAVKEELEAWSVRAMSRCKTSPVRNEKAVSAAVARTREMAKGTYFGDIRYRPFDQDLRASWATLQRIYVVGVVHTSERRTFSGSSPCGQER
jgi:hypothetical protein